MQPVMIFLAIGAGVASVVLSAPALRRHTSPGESLSVGTTGAVISGLLALAFCGHDLADPVSALSLLASAAGAAALLGVTLSSGQTQTSHQRDE